jgi:hypothetical protein
MFFITGNENTFPNVIKLGEDFFAKNNFSHKGSKALREKALLFSSLCFGAFVANCMLLLRSGRKQITHKNL